MNSISIVKMLHERYEHYRAQSLYAQMHPISGTRLTNNLKYKLRQKAKGDPKYAGMNKYALERIVDASYLEEYYAMKGIQQAQDLLRAIASDLSKRANPSGQIPSPDPVTTANANAFRFVADALGDPQEVLDELREKI